MHLYDSITYKGPVFIIVTYFLMDIVVNKEGIRHRCSYSSRIYIMYSI